LGGFVWEARELGLGGKRDDERGRREKSRATGEGGGLSASSPR
jgi:hypothetical protein